MRYRCPHCGAPLPIKRYGVAFTRLKAKILDLAEKGIESDALYERVFSGRERPSREAMKAHIWQINDALANTDWRIVHRHGSYLMEKCRW